MSIFADDRADTPPDRPRCLIAGHAITGGRILIEIGALGHGKIRQNGPGTAYWGRFRSN
jgi:hypothetical protein